MPKDLEMQPIEPSSIELDLAATARRRIRLHGIVTDAGGGYSGRYRNVWLRVRSGDTTVEFTASPTSKLGTAPHQRRGRRGPHPDRTC